MVVVRHMRSMAAVRVAMMMVPVVLMAAKALATRKPC
jgi:hypothetical protein